MEKGLNYEHTNQYDYLDPRRVSDISIGSLGILLQGEVNASCNFADSPGKFGKDWCSETRIRGLLKPEKNVRNFTVEDIYGLLDETHNLIKEQNIISRVFYAKNYAQLEDSALSFLRNQISEYYEEIISRKSKFLDIDFFEKLTWNELNNFVTDTLEIMQKNNKDENGDEVYDSEISKWQNMQKEIEKHLKE